MAADIDLFSGWLEDSRGISPAVRELQSLGVQVKRVEKPLEEKEARQLLARAFQDKQTIFPCGGGTSLSSGVLPEKVDLALDTTGMNKILAFDSQNLNLEVLAGMTLDEINEFLAGQGRGFYLPLDPPFSHRATIGGAYAANSSGPLRHRYGTIRDQVLGVRGVDSRGQAVGFGGKTVKNVSGYDLTKFLIGSAGSLCLVTSLSLRVYPMPEASSLCDLVFGTLEELEKFLAAFRSSVLVPSAAVVTEIAGGPSVSSTAGARFRVMVVFEGHPLAVERQNKDLLKLAGEFGGCGDARAGREMVVRGLRSAANPDRPLEASLILRVSVPIGHGPRTFANVQKLSHEHGLSVKPILFAGNGLLILYGEGTLQKKAMDFIRGLQETIRAAGGFVTPILAPREFLQAWGARVEPTLRRLVLGPIKEKLDPTGVFPPIL
jgi:glycolate oxidase FAD binding subunit